MTQQSDVNQSPDLVSSTRKVGLLLALGILFLPPIFSWLLLRRGYSLLARALAFSWLMFFLFHVLYGDPSAVSESNAPSTVPVKQEVPAINQRTTPAVEVVRLPKETLVCFDRGDWDLMLQSVQDRNVVQVKILLESARCMYTSNDTDVRFLDPASSHSALIQLPSGRAGFVLLQDIGK